MSFIHSFNKLSYRVLTNYQQGVDKVPDFTELIFYQRGTMHKYPNETPADSDKYYGDYITG